MVNQWQWCPWLLSLIFKKYIRTTKTSVKNKICKTSIVFHYERQFINPLNFLSKILIVNICNEIKLELINWHMISQLIYSSKKIVITFESKYGHTINYVLLFLPDHWKILDSKNWKSKQINILYKGYLLVKIKNNYM